MPLTPKPTTLKEEGKHTGMKTISNNESLGGKCQKWGQFRNPDFFEF